MSVQTDDLGQFRLYGLTAGDYSVVAETRGPTFVPPNAPAGDRGRQDRIHDDLLPRHRGRRIRGARARPGRRGNARDRNPHGDRSAVPRLGLGDGFPGAPTRAHRRPAAASDGRRLGLERLWLLDRRTGTLPDAEHPAGHLPARRAAASGAVQPRRHQERAGRDGQRGADRLVRPGQRADPDHARGDDYRPDRLRTGPAAARDRSRSASTRRPAIPTT